MEKTKTLYKRVNLLKDEDRELIAKIEKLDNFSDWVKFKITEYKKNKLKGKLK